MDIREIRGRRELRAVEELQKEVWGCDDREVVPLASQHGPEASAGYRW